MRGMRCGRAGIGGRAGGAGGAGEGNVTVSTPFCRDLVIFAPYFCRELIKNAYEKK